MAKDVIVSSSRRSVTASPPATAPARSSMAFRKPADPPPVVVSGGVRPASVSARLATCSCSSSCSLTRSRVPLRGRSASPKPALASLIAASKPLKDLRARARATRAAASTSPPPGPVDGASSSTRSSAGMSLSDRIRLRRFRRASGSAAMTGSRGSDAATSSSVRGRAMGEGGQPSPALRRDPETANKRLATEDTLKTVHQAAAGVTLGGTAWSTYPGAPKAFRSAAAVGTLAGPKIARS